MNHHFDFCIVPWSDPARANHYAHNWNRIEHVTEMALDLVAGVQVPFIDPRSNALRLQTFS